MPEVPYRRFSELASATVAHDTVTKETGIEQTRRRLLARKNFHAAQLDRIERAVSIIEEDSRIKELNDILRIIDEA